MFMNEDVFEIVLIIGSSTDYEFSAAIYIFRDACGYRQARGMYKIGGVWFSLPTNKLIFDSQKRKITYENFDCIQFVLDSLLILALTHD